MTTLTDICAGSAIIVCTGWAIMAVIGLVLTIKDALRRPCVFFDMGFYVVATLVFVGVAYGTGHYLRPILDRMFS